MSNNSTHVTLAADLLAMRARQLVTALAAHHFEPLDQLREALDTYSEVRAGGTIAAAQITDCSKCRIVGTCLTPGEPGCEEFEPVTLRSSDLVPLHSALRHLSVETDSSAYARAVAFESEAR